MADRPAARRRAFRLPRHILPSAYSLSIEVDPTRGRGYRGSVEVELSLSRSCDEIALHAADLRIGRVSLHTGERVHRGRVVLEHDNEAIRIHFARAIPAGRATLSIRFAGSLRDDLRGLYLARSGKHRYAVTQLEAADARRFFPCFDEPSFKATFRLSVTTRRELSVVSNSPIERVARPEAGKKRVDFATTPIISSYLVALIVGELSASNQVLAGRTPIRVWHVPSKRRLTAFALQTAKQCLLRLERYFGVPYAYGKLDLVAVPDFEIGAMENAGAVFFRETLLLIDERSATLPEQKRAAEVICHELAHMWFGNLVTMAWWDDLWLNEAFATWMAFEIVSRLRPDLKMWNDFGQYRDSAFELDALPSTHPIYARVRTADEATENFDAITYEKGAAVVRMVERYLGPATFRRGVQRYIRRHREGNARASDLWNALTEAVEHDAAADGTAPSDVEGLVRPWLERSGFPLLRVAPLNGKKQGLRLRQEQFRALQRRGRSKREAPWPLPVRVRTGAGLRNTARALLTKSRGQMLLPRGARFAYGNADESGFYRCLHDRTLLTQLLERPQALTAAERIGLVSHQWAVVSAGYAGVETFLDIVDALSGEDDPDVLTVLLPALTHLADDVAKAAGPETQAALRAHLRLIFAPSLDDVGWTTRRDDAPAARLRRALLLHVVAVVAEDAAAIELSEGLCERYLERPGAVEPNLAMVAVTVGATRGDERRHAQFVSATNDAATPQQQRRFRMALGDFRTAATIRKSLALCLTPAIPTQDVALLLARLLSNPKAGETAWRFIKRNWRQLSARMPPMLASRLIDATPALGSEQHRRDVVAFFKQHPIPTAARALRLADERFRINEAFRAREKQALARYLKRAARRATAP